MEILFVLDVFKGVSLTLGINLLLHRHHHLFGVLRGISFTERRRGWTPMCVEYEEMAVSEIHQST